MVGGDDGRFYYLYPLQYLKNFSFHIMSDNTLGGNMGYFAVSSSAPTIFFLFLLKTILPMVNIQLLAYGAILSLGFIFFYLFLQEWLPGKTAFAQVSAVIASLLYVLSPYVTRTYFQDLLISIFIIMVVPCCLYFFVSGVKRKSMRRVVTSALVYSLFSSTVLSLPSFLPAIFMMIPLLMYLAIQYKNFFWKAISVVILLIALFNFYWIIHFLVPVIFSSGESLASKTIGSQAFIKQNNDLIAALVHLNSPAYQLISYLRTSWSEREGATIAESLGIVYILTILGAGMVLRRAKKYTRTLYLIVVGSLLVTMFFFTPDFGEWNLYVFQWLNNHVPFFAMFRNMYDKFALAMAFQYAFAVYVAFVILEESRMQRYVRIFALIIVSSVMLFMAYPYLVPNYNDAAYSTRVTGVLNQDFTNMMTYLADHPTPYRYLWMPMTFPGYVYISDATLPDHFYAGISPLQVLSKSSDVAGYYGLQTTLEPFLNGKVFDLLKLRNYDAVAKILASQNVGYVIVNHEKLPDKALISLDANNFMSDQNVAYSNVILGKKIQDFGARYSLYTLNDTYRLPTVYMTQQSQPTADSVQSVNFTNPRTNEFDVSLHVKELTNVVLAEPYSPFWSVSISYGNSSHTLSLPHTSVLEYGNQWYVNPATIAARYPSMVKKYPDGSYDFHLVVQFWPEELVVPTLVVSGISILIAIMYLCIRSL